MTENEARKTRKSSVKCSVPGCPNYVEHWHHTPVLKSDGGVEVTGMCADHHIATHSACGDFAKWGRIGGQKVQKVAPHVRENLRKGK